MEIMLDIGFEQLLDLIKKLPAGKIKQLKTALDDDFIKEKAEKELSDFQSFLLKGPVMDANQYAQHVEDRRHFNKWRTK